MELSLWKTVGSQQAHPQGKRDTGSNPGFQLRNCSTGTVFWNPAQVRLGALMEAGYKFSLWLQILSSECRQMNGGQTDTMTGILLLCITLTEVLSIELYTTQ